MTMRLFVLGATGRTGAQVVDLALARGHSVTAFVRSPEKLTQRHERLAVQRGDPSDVEQLTAAVSGHDAVISVLGPPTRDALRPSTLVAQWALITVRAMTASRVKRLVIISAAVLFPMPGLRFAFFRWFLRHHARDLTAMESVVRASELDWTIARPPRLTPAYDASYVSQRDAMPNSQMVVSFRAVASFMLDCAEQHAHVHETVGLARPASA
jgi:putative NADH-flavin reductase